MITSRRPEAGRAQRRRMLIEASTLVALAGVTLAATDPAVASSTAPLLESVAELTLPGPPSRFDYTSLDRTTGRLYLNHMNAGQVIVFDTRERQVVKVLSGFSRCTGILAVPSLARVFVSTPGTGEVAVVDTRDYAVLARLPAGRFPDGLAFDAATQRLYVSDEMGRAVIVIDATAMKVLGRIALGGEVGNTQVDPQAHLVYSNDQTHGDLVAIDPAGMSLQKRIPLGITGNHGLCLDPPRHLAFITSETRDELLVLDLTSETAIARFPVGHEPDVLAFDPSTRRLFVASERGPLFVFRETADGIIKEGEQNVGANAHVVAFDPTTNLLYLPLPKLQGHPVLQIMKLSGRP